MTSGDHIIFIVDDDDSMRRALVELLAYVADLWGFDVELRGVGPDDEQRYRYDLCEARRREGCRRQQADDCRAHRNGHRSFSSAIRLPPARICLCGKLPRVHPEFNCETLRFPSRPGAFAVARQGSRDWDWRLL